MIKKQLHGIIVPILTPIDDCEHINEQKLREQVDFVIKGGVSGILVFGSNGEFYMVKEEEQKEVLRVVLSQTNNRVPVFMGIGTISTRQCIHVAETAISMGATAVSVLPPMFLKPSEAELFSHFQMIAASISDAPMLLYNNPGRIGYTLSANLVERLAHEIPNIVGIKDSSGDITLTSEFIRRNRDVGLKVFSGKDTLVYAALCQGAAGGVCTTANFLPQLVCSIYSAYMSGNLSEALELQYRLNPIRLAMDLSSFPVATKDYCNLFGMEVGNPYLPTRPASGHGREALVHALKEAGYMKNG